MTLQNLLQVFERTATPRLQKLCLQYSDKGQWQNLTWAEVKEQVEKLTDVLCRIGVVAGDSVCILAKTRYEWTLADLAVLSCGGATVPIYESNTAEQAAFVISDAAAKVIFVENQVQLQKIKTVWSQLPNLQAVIIFDSQDKLLEKNRVLSWRECLLTADAVQGKKIYLKSLNEIQPTQIASIVYTSGTTGNPKGAVLTHDNFLAAIEAGSATFPFRDDMIGLIFLPLAHILGRITQFYQIANGFVHTYAESIEKLVDNIATVRPHFMVSVPRIFEKIHERTLYSLQSMSSVRKTLFNWAMAVGERFASYRMQGKTAPLFLRLQNAVADRLVFQKLKQKLGARLEFCISGGAPLSPEVGRFFAAAGIVVVEGYGLTETTAANAVNRLNATKIGTVGKPLPGVQIKLADDGEILICGRVVFSGYRNNLTATSEAIDTAGWFHSGDVGEIDTDGFLKITDRKKEIIVTAGGKKISPQNIENLLKADPYISQVIVHGDRRKFISALVTLNKDMIENFAKQHTLNFTNFADLVQNPKVYALIKDTIERKNAGLAQFESIKKFAILPNDFTIESGELTPSLKLKRKVITQKYQSVFDNFYQE